MSSQCNLTASHASYPPETKCTQGATGRARAGDDDSLDFAEEEADVSTVAAGERADACAPAATGALENNATLDKGNRERPGETIGRVHRSGRRVNAMAENTF